MNYLFDAIFLYAVTKFDIYNPAVKIRIYKQNKSSTEQSLCVQYQLLPHKADTTCPVSITYSQS
jgi:hypothetical protein